MWRCLLGSQVVRTNGSVTAPAGDRVELLRRSPIFEPLPEAALEALAAKLIPFSVTANEAIVQPVQQVPVEGGPR